ncbi:DUF4254 domain-containing protein [Amycolatopsis sp. CA-126428]|uniref:DUF4254 domain-containing protein n=1 Tax=Amycolatopsis sp. CA-126428 TaxID=2073158 RepID=UPI000CD0502C|nr:DUF4254 domain-containing protein [Amycolatopsis sp. CA-126428]
MTSTKAVIPALGVDHVPRAALVVRAFNVAPDDPHPLLVAAVGLAAQHRVRAQAHRVTCDRAADDHVVAAAARAVNAADSACAGLVDQIDQWSAVVLPRPRTAAVHTETLGELVNRLAAGWVRWHLLAAHDGRAAARRRVGEAFRQLGELTVGYDDLVADLVSGRRRLPQHQMSTSPAAA